MSRGTRVVAVMFFCAGVGSASAQQVIGPNQHFIGLVNASNADPAVYVVCPGAGLCRPDRPGRVQLLPLSGPLCLRMGSRLRDRALHRHCRLSSNPPPAHRRRPRPLPTSQLRDVPGGISRQGRPAARIPVRRPADRDGDHDRLALRARLAVPGTVTEQFAPARTEQLAPARPRHSRTCGKDRTPLGQRAALTPALASRRGPSAGIVPERSATC